jgi:hypothetical protein
MKTLICFAFLVMPSLTLLASDVILPLSNEAIKDALDNVGSSNRSLLQTISIQYSGDNVVPTVDLQDERRRKQFPLRVPVAAHLQHINQKPDARSDSAVDENQRILHISRIELAIHAYSSGWFISAPGVQCRIVLQNNTTIESPLVGGYTYKQGIIKHPLPNSLAAFSYAEAIHRSLILGVLIATQRVSVKEAEKYSDVPSIKDSLMPKPPDASKASRSR